MICLLATICKSIKTLFQFCKQKATMPSTRGGKKTSPGSAKKPMAKGKKSLPKHASPNRAAAHASPNRAPAKIKIEPNL